MEEEEKIEKFPKVENGEKETQHIDNENIFKKYTKNIQEINSLKTLIKENKEIYSNKIKNIKNDIIILQNKLSSMIIPNIKNSQKALEQNLLKQKIISNTISIYKEEFDSIQENINLLEEEHNNCSIQLYNLISIKDNYEEIIKENSKYIFKNLMISYDQNTGQSVSYNLMEEQFQNLILNDKNNIEIESYDVYNITNLTNFCEYIYKLLSSNIASLINQTNIKALIFSSIEETFYNFFEKKIKRENFIKKISYSISTIDDKIHNFIIIPRLEILLKYILKIFSLEKVINDYMNFLNKDYLYSKNAFQKKFNEIKICIQKYTKEKLEYKKNYIIKEKEYNKKLEVIKDIEKIKKDLYEKEKTLKIEQNRYLINEIKYKNKIKKLEMINKNINSDENDVQKTLENIQENINNLFNKIKNEKITDKPKHEKKEKNNLDNEKLLNNNYNYNYNNCDCYILICNESNNIIYDPLNDYDIKPEIKGYNKSLISLLKNNINIKFNYLKEEINLEISLNLIVNIIIHQNMKKIIYYLYKYNKEKNNNIKILLNEENEKNKGKNNEEFEEIIKCIFNKYFCLSIVLSNKKIINFIFLTYNSFKSWLKLLDNFYQKNKWRMLAK